MHKRVIGSQHILIPMIHDQFLLGNHAQGFHGINSSGPGDAYMRQLTGSSLAKLMVWQGHITNPLPEVMVTYHHSDRTE